MLQFCRMNCKSCRSVLSCSAAIISYSCDEQCTFSCSCPDGISLKQFVTRKEKQTQKPAYIKRIFKSRSAILFDKPNQHPPFKKRFLDSHCLYCQVAFVTLSLYRIRRESLLVYIFKSFCISTRCCLCEKSDGLS